jgi:hypothetical protein
VLKWTDPGFDKLSTRLLGNFNTSPETRSWIHKFILPHRPGWKAGTLNPKDWSKLIEECFLGFGIPNYHTCGFLFTLAHVRFCLVGVAHFSACLLFKK